MCSFFFFYQRLEKCIRTASKAGRQARHAHCRKNHSEIRSRQKSAGGRQLDAIENGDDDKSSMHMANTALRTLDFDQIIIGFYSNSHFNVRNTGVRINHCECFPMTNQSKQNLRFFFVVVVHESIALSSDCNLRTH